MAYRTYVGTTGKNEIQILGNNECYQPFIDELIKQGIKVDEDACYGLEEKSTIKDIQPFIDILEQYIWNKDNETKMYNVDIFNLRPNKKDLIKDLTFKMRELKENGYIFVSANLVDYLKDNLEIKFDIETHKYTYKIKDGKEVWFSAY